MEDERIDRDPTTSFSTNSSATKIQVKQNTQKGKKEIQDRIVGYLELYSKMMGLEHWTIVCGFKKLGSDYLAQCEAEVEYYKAVITFDSVKLEEHDDSKVRMTVIHELLHCLVWRLTEVAQHLAPDEHKDFIQKFDESVVTDLERMPVWNLALAKIGD